MDVRVAEDHIHFRCYPFPGATVHPAGTLTPDQIRDADRMAAPPEIRTIRGETLFVPAGKQSEIEQFCHRNGVAEKHRPDTWSDLLEPFLDTWFDPDHERATADRLRQAGFADEEVAEIRRRLTPLMRAYNIESMLWDLVGLGLFDLLNAATGPLVPAGVQATIGDPVAFYDWAMGIAERHR